jgi:hypothetical protein
MAKIYSFDTNYMRIQASSDDANDPLTFEDIYQYFKSNPLTATFEFPRDSLICSGYELCEQNASNWIPSNGFDSPVDDGVDYTHNSYSISAEVTSIPTPDTSATAIKRSSNQYIRVFMPNTSAYSANKHIRITGTTNFNGIYLIQSVASSYLQLRVPKSVDDKGPGSSGGSPADETSLTILKPLSLIWNDDRALARVFAIGQCQTIKFSLKTDSSETSPKCIGIALRNMYTTNSEDVEYRNYYGANLLKDFEITSTWQDFEVTIKDEFDPSLWVAGANLGSRGYWSLLGKVGFFFDGLAVGDTVWLDGVRFNAQREITKPSENSNIYRFTLGLYITGYFKDFGFNVIFDCLDSPCGRYPTMGQTNSFFFNSSALGNMELGDYSVDFSERDGGIFYIDNFSHEDTGIYNFNNIYLQGILFRGNKGVAAASGFTLNNSKFYDCTFQNMLDINTNNAELINCKWFGGRYLDRQSAGLVLNNTAAIGVRGQIIFDQKATAYKDVNGLRAVGQNTVVYSYNYGGSTKIYGKRLINLDATGCTNPIIEIGVGGGAYESNHLVAYTMNFKIIDENGDAIENAGIVLKDKNGTQVFSETTDSDGIITEQVVDTLHAKNDGSATKRYYFNTPDVDWIKYYPFTLTISKSGYKTYETILEPEGKLDLTITLKKTNDVVDENGTYHIANDENAGLIREDGFNLIEL